MGLYDQLLNVTQQGLDRNNQITMTAAQQPTMADVFMDRFRQGGQDQLARQKAQAEMEYHNQLAENAKMDKQGKALGVAFQHGNPTNIGAILPFLQKAGVDTSGFNPETFTGSKQYGADTGLEGKQYSADTNYDIALLKKDMATYALQLKSMDPKSALGKLDKDYVNSQGKPWQMSDQDYVTMKAKLGFVGNPQIGPAAAQGYTVPTNALPPMSRALPGPGQPPTQSAPQNTQQPSSTVIPNGLESASVRASGPVGYTPVAPNRVQSQPGAQPGPVLPPGARPNSKLLKEQADNESKTQGLIDSLDNYIRLATQLKDHPGARAGVTVPYLGFISNGSPESLAYQAGLKTLKSNEALSQVRQLKEQSGTGLRVTQQEWNGLENAIANLDTKLSPEDRKKNLETIQAFGEKIRDTAIKHKEELTAARGLTSNGGASPKGAMSLEDYLASQGK